MAYIKVRGFAPPTPFEVHKICSLNAVQFILYTPYFHYIFYIEYQLVSGATRHFGALKLNIKWGPYQKNVNGVKQSKVHSPLP